MYVSKINFCVRVGMLSAESWTPPLKQIYFPLSLNEIVRIRGDFQKAIYVAQVRESRDVIPVTVEHAGDDTVHTVATIDHSMKQENDHLLAGRTQGPHIRFSEDYECRAMQLNWFDSNQMCDSTMLVRCVHKSDLDRMPSRNERRFVKRAIRNKFLAPSYWASLAIKDDFPENKPEWKCKSKEEKTKEKKMETTQRELFLEVNTFSRLPGVSTIFATTELQDGRIENLQMQMHKDIPLHFLLLF